eukprot:TRINITY_DN12314_c0_g1_i2.p1 TRINITY_DN12314_c0_g1~~TRINITY_DN12314_c0_g1_i2.p1  ORF type:complete len:384 (-),score=70.04 TRINITY_DN12314_c0_g1_i2:68-1219(-)
MAFPHAAAAISGARRSREGGGGSIFSGRTGVSTRIFYTSDNAQYCPVFVAVLFSLALAASGLTFLVRAWNNDREAKLSSFHNSVEVWTATERAALARAHFEVGADWAGAGNESREMMGARLKGFVLHDAERGSGVDDYDALAHVTNFEFPESFENVSGAELSAYREAPEAVLKITTHHANGTEYLVGAVHFPLVYVEVSTSLTAHAANRCMHREHGVRRGHQCLLGKRLAHICMQVERSAAGQWQLRRKPEDENGPGSVYGCDPLNYWYPAVYDVDACLPKPDGRTCKATYEHHHHIDVTLRSSSDPLLRIETLTNDTFDFGMGSITQQVYGTTMLIIGFVFGLLPCISCLRNTSCKRTRSTKVEITMPTGTENVDAVVDAEA